MKTTVARKIALGLVTILAGFLLLTGCGGGDDEPEACGTDPDTFCLDSSDRSLAASYSASFDWTTDKIALRLLAAPTRSEAEKALYFQNPGLYQDPGSEPQITPDPLPSLDPSPAGFDFELSDLAPNPNSQFLDNSSIVDSLAETPISQTEQNLAPLWLPAVMVYLSVDWDSSQVLDLYYANSAVRGQKWGSSEAMLPPQTIQHMYLHDGEIWVEIAFEDHVDLGAGISDSNGDGAREIFGKIDPSHYTSAVYDEIQNNYVDKKLTVNELDNLIDNKIVDDLYSSFPMEPVGDMGTPFEIPEVGTVNYPFKVLQGFSPKDDISIVLLVEP